jgi:hypothetical protein
MYVQQEWQQAIDQITDFDAFLKHKRKQLKALL